VRVWTVEEANAALDDVRTVVERLQWLLGQLRSRGPELPPRANGHRASYEAEVKRRLRELDDDGIVLRDPGRGLVDFTAVAPSGRRYWLCWLTSEDAVEWWHWPEDGFAGRTPLAQPPE
jgi:hypothetical protein